jgi:hypothetical protein
VKKEREKRPQKKKAKAIIQRISLQLSSMSIAHIILLFGTQHKPVTGLAILHTSTTAHHSGVAFD